MSQSASGARRADGSPFHYRSDNPYFQTDLAEHHFRGLRVRGRLPDPVSGTLLYTAPASTRLGTPDEATRGLFERHTKLHAVTLGKDCTFRSRFLRTPEYRQELRSGRVLGGMGKLLQFPMLELHARELMSSPLDWLRMRMRQGARPTCTVYCPAIVSHGGRLFAVTESLPATEFDLELRTLGSGLPGLPQKLSSPHYAEMGTHKAFLSDRWNATDVCWLPARGDAEVDSIPKTPRGKLLEASAHDLCTAGDFVVFHSFFLSGSLTRPISPTEEWEIKVAKKGQGAQTVRVPDGAPFPIHYVRGRELSSARLEVHAVCIGSTQRLFHMLTATNWDENAILATLHRIEIDLSRGEATFSDTLLESVELPTMNYAAPAPSNAYVCRIRDQRGELLKYDLATGGVDLWRSDGAVSQCQFVADPAREGQEDGGFLLAYAYEHPSTACEVLVFDAQGLAKGPIARVELPARVGYGTHTWFEPRV